MFAWNLWKAEMPYLRSLHAQRSVVLRSVMPSITPVNFAAMVTGTDRAGHGVGQRTDPFACETLFDVVRRAGGKSAGIGINDYTGTALLGRYADICGNAGQGTDDTVTEKIIEIAGRDAPMFLIAQLGRVDDAFHKYGPSAPEIAPMLRDTDARLRRLVEQLTPLGYGVIILADHGQHDVPNPPPGAKRGTHGTDCDEDCRVPCTWV
jgi:predicted AlkP superfamily pyrophosphatase or phosphodiesterase